MVAHITLVDGVRVRITAGQQADTADSVKLKTQSIMDIFKIVVNEAGTLNR